MKRNHRTIVFLLLTATLGTFVPRNLPAQILYVSNLANADDSGVVCDGSSWDAAEFTTGGNLNGYSLDSIQIAIDGILVVDGSGFSLSLYSNNSGQPGSSVGVLSGSSNPSVAGNYTYTASGVTLSASTSYWVVGDAATAFPNGSFLWGDTTSPAYTSSGGWSINNATRDISHDGGSTWTATGVSLLRFSVTATAVPEPQSFALAGLGLTLVFFRRRK
ncbi:MAG: choice-of-anchor R domain-containing protein [Limisphaerales bacterium]